MIQTRVACYGSLNHDIAVWLPRLPLPDETLRADRLEEFQGGKGANQVTAAARLGASSSMIGCVGRDRRGNAMVDGLDRNGVDHTHVTRVDAPTGTAIPLVGPSEVSIVIVPGANAVTGPAHADAAGEVIAGADVLMLQGEVGAAGSRRAAEIATEAGTLVLFNPAPPEPDVVTAVLPLASVVVLNRHERELVDVPADTRVVLTLGAAGAQADGVEVPPFPAEVVDPTGAGDAFCAALAVGLAEGRDLGAATRFANAAGALAVGVAGAQPSMPSRTAVDELMRARPQA